MAGAKQSTSTDTRVLERIAARGSGWVFTPAEFADLGTSQAVRLALMRAARAGTIRRLARGIYDSPRRHPKLGLLSPSPEAVAGALQARDGSRLLIDGASAANALGLSDQVPAQSIFQTDGRSREVRIGKQRIVLKRRSSRAMASAGRPSAFVIAALESLGPQAVDDEVLAKLRSRLKPDQLRDLAADARYASEWIAECLRKLSASSDQGSKAHG